jgi:secretion/DNA translocation related TadE-like protein
MVVGACGALAAVMGGALLVAGVVRDVHRAQGAADLAALAAVVPVARGGGHDCGAATRVAAANGARLRGCAALPDGSVTVEVGVVVGATLTGRPGWPVPGEVAASARAGVVTAGPGK